MHPEVVADANYSAEKSSGRRGRKAWGPAHDAAGHNEASKAVRKDMLDTWAARGRDQNVGESQPPGGRCPGNREINLDAWRTLYVPVKIGGKVPTHESNYG